MKLSLYVDKILVETIPVHCSITIRNGINELRSRHKSTIQKGTSHSFIVENVPSVINDFKPLTELTAR